MQPQLFEGDKIRLTAFDPERDAEAFSQWTHDPEYMRMLDIEPARPLSPFQIKKNYEAMEKDKGRELYYFAIRTRADDRAIGFARIFWIEWNHGSARLNLGIGSAADRGHGLGTEALQLLLRYGFDEMNLYRLTVATMEYNTVARRLLERAGFQPEVRRRQAVYREGQRWDLISYGLLRSEWQGARVNSTRSGKLNPLG